ncbi:MAG: hypothetical protein IIY77_01935 [Lachnospiraceae bacterium]|nr:hypothetical protein [Lachnospiraceae bacterium]
MTAESVTEAVTQAAADIDVDALVEKYGQMKVPALTMVMTAAVVVFLVVLIVLGFIYVSRHYVNFSNGIYAGILAELIFGYVAYGALNFAFQKIGPVDQFLKAHQQLGDCLLILVAVILECLAVFLGMKYLLRMNGKRHLETNIGHVVTFGLSTYAAAILVSQQLTYAIEYIMVSNTMNSLGMEVAVYQMLINGASEAEADATVRGMVESSWLKFLWDGFTYVLRAVVVTSSAVLVYGTERRGLDRKKWLPIAVLMIAAYYIPTLLNTVTEVHAAVLIVLTLLITAACAFIALRTVYKEMPSDWEDLKRKPVKKPKKKDSDKDKKMPKIVMPD